MLTRAFSGSKNFPESATRKNHPRLGRKAAAMQTVLVSQLKRGTVLIEDLRADHFVWPLGIGLACALALLAPAADPTPGQKQKSTMKLTSNAFSENQPIPIKHTCQGADISPPLKWTDVPPGTTSLALICDDPDA